MFGLTRNGLEILRGRMYLEGESGGDSGSSDSSSTSSESSDSSSEGMSDSQIQSIINDAYNPDGTYKYSDPGYTKKGYYGSGGNYDNGSQYGTGSTRYYEYRKTLGGNIANALGYDPEGWGAKAINFLGGISGLFNPIAGLAFGLGNSLVGKNWLGAGTSALSALFGPAAGMLGGFAQSALNGPESVGKFLTTGLINSQLKGSPLTAFTGQGVNALFNAVANREPSNTPGAITSNDNSSALAQFNQGGSGGSNYNTPGANSTTRKQAIDDLIYGEA